jgi:hypothetical protein
MFDHFEKREGNIRSFDNFFEIEPLPNASDDRRSLISRMVLPYLAWHDKLILFSPRISHGFVFLNIQNGMGLFRPDGPAVADGLSPRNILVACSWNSMVENETLLLEVPSLLSLARESSPSLGCDSQDIFAVFLRLFFVCTIRDFASIRTSP